MIIATMDKIERCCRERKDYDLERLIGGDFSKLPAVEAKYHRNCYNMYLKKTTTVKSKDTIHDICFKLLVDEKVDPALSDGRALNINTLLTQFKEYLKDKEYDDYDAYTSQKLKQRLVKHYGSSICVTQEINQTQSIYSSNTCITEVINIAANYKQMIKDRELIENVDVRTEQLIERVVGILKSDIQNVKGIPILPLDPEDISRETIESLVPHSLKSFLDKLCDNFGSKHGKVIAQDIISLNSNGKKRMPKNVGLGLSLKNSTRSKEFITYLNNLGHSISYDDVLRIDTTWVTSILERR